MSLALAGIAIVVVGGILAFGAAIAAREYFQYRRDVETMEIEHQDDEAGD